MEISCWTVYPEDPLLLEYELNDVNCEAKRALLEPTIRFWRPIYTQHNLLALWINVAIPKQSMELNNFYSSSGVIESDVFSLFSKPHFSEQDETDYSLSCLSMPTIRLFTGSGFLKEFLLTIFQLLLKGFYDHLKEGTTKLYCGPLNHCKWASNDKRFLF